MSKIYTSADQLIGKTPLLELSHIEKAEKLEAKLLAKLEYFNPAGSVKDRIAKAILDDAEASGKLKPDSVIIEPTSGNTGIGLAAVAAAKRELGSAKAAAGVVVMQCGIAWVVAFVVHCIGTLLGFV